MCAMCSQSKADFGVIPSCPIVNYQFKVIILTALVLRRGTSTSFKLRQGPIVSGRALCLADRLIYDVMVAASQVTPLINYSSKLKEIISLICLMRGKTRCNYNIYKLTWDGNILLFLISLWLRSRLDVGGHWINPGSWITRN